MRFGELSEWQSKEGNKDVSVRCLRVLVKVGCPCCPSLIRKWVYVHTARPCRQSFSAIYLSKLAKVAFKKREPIVDHFQCRTDLIYFHRRFCDQMKAWPCGHHRGYIRIIEACAVVLVIKHICGHVQTGEFQLVIMPPLVRWYSSHPFS
jgi:hypothetical protein